jgi:hypothetical protein
MIINECISPEVALFVDFRAVGQISEVGGKADVPRTSAIGRK